MKTTPTETLETDAGNESTGDVSVIEVEIAEDQATITDPPEQKKKGKKKAPPKSLPTGAKNSDCGGKTVKSTQTSNKKRKAASVARKAVKNGKKTTSGGKVSKKAKKKKGKKLSSTITLGELAVNYLAHLEEIGKGHGTLFSYGIELKMACRELGENTKVSSLTVKKVKAYFESDAVTKNRKGKDKAKPTIDKTRRILRLALVWLEETGAIEKAPIPDMKKDKSKK